VAKAAVGHGFSEVLCYLFVMHNDVPVELFVESMAQLIGLHTVTTQCLYTVLFPSAEPEQTKMSKVNHSL